MLTQQQLARKEYFEKYYQNQTIKLQIQKDKRLEVKDQTKDPKEMQGHIHKEFTNRYDSILTPIKEGQITVEKQVTQLIDEYKLLFSYYVDISYALIAYDKQQYKEQLEQLESSLYNLRASIVPRQQFKFSKPFPKPTLQVEAQVNNQTGKREEYMSDSIVVSPDTFVSEITAQSGSVVLQQLVDKVFTVNGQLDTLYLHSLKNTIVNVGIIGGSVWVYDCVGCTFTGQMHQLRIHDTTDTKFIIHVQSNPIIERSNQLQFGKYGEQENNLWDQVQDFNWLRQERSPNFILI